MKERRLGKQSKVLSIVPFGPTTLNKMVKEDKFPGPIVFAGGRTKYWDMEEVQAWIQDQMDSRPIAPEKQAHPEVFSAWYARPAKKKKNGGSESPIPKSEPEPIQTLGKTIHRMVR